MSEAMKNIVMILGGEIEGDIWSEIYGLTKDELLVLFKEFDYATHNCVFSYEYKDVRYWTAVGIEEHYEDIAQ